LFPGRSISQIRKLEDIAPLVSLTNLDMSYNKIKVIEGLDGMASLKTLYLAK